MSPPPPAPVRVARIREEPGDDDGTRVLVDRLWPRGLAKADAAYDEWCRDVAPSSELRKWFSHDPERHDEFARRYGGELGSGEAAEAFARLRDVEGPLTLLTATRDVDLSHAKVLAGLLDTARGASSST